MEIEQATSNVVGVDRRAPLKPQTDIAIVGSIAKGDQDAMRVLFCRYRLPVYRFALRLTRNRTTAEDIVSEVFLEVWRHAERFEVRSRVSTWLLAIARNQAYATMRRPTEPLSVATMEELAERSDTPEVVTAQNQQSAMLAHCLTKLSPAHRETIDLVYYHGKSVDEVAEIIGIPPGTVKTRMHYARLEIARLMAPRPGIAARRNNKAAPRQGSQHRAHRPAPFAVASTRK